jgi:hypothetical protein
MSESTGPTASMNAPQLDQKQSEAQTRAFVVAWAFTVIFFFLEYAVRSSPSVMIPELETSFNTTALGISTILGMYLLHVLLHEPSRWHGARLI